MADDAEGRRNLAIWLEDTKIRHYKIEDRTGLRSTDPTAWEAAFVKVRQAIAIADIFKNYFNYLNSPPFWIHNVGKTGTFTSRVCCAHRCTIMQ